MGEVYNACVRVCQAVFFMSAPYTSFRVYSGVMLNNDSCDLYGDKLRRPLMSSVYHLAYPSTTTTTTSTTTSTTTYTACVVHIVPLVYWIRSPHFPLRPLPLSPA